MDKQKVYIITRGEYSDYHIKQVFSTRQKAVEFLDTVDDSYQLEEYDLDEPIERKTQIYRICFKLDKKKVARVAIHNSDKFKDLIHIVHRTYNDENLLEIYVESDSRKRALKIASERYGAIIAGEQTIFPYLRMGVVGYYGSAEPAYYDFNTGELVLVGDMKLAVDLPPFIRVKRI
jgi:hypothetical protein